MQEVVNALPGGYPESIQPPTSNQQSLSQAVYARRSEYTRPRDIKIKVCSILFLLHQATSSGAPQR
jgi:phosphatidylinositol-bisphosphatase